MLFNVLVIMSSMGDIYIGALGTDPNIFSPPRPEARQINYDEADAEMSSLNQVIKSLQSQDSTQATKNLHSGTKKLEFLQKSLFACFMLSQFLTWKSRNL